MKKGPIIGIKGYRSFKEAKQKIMDENLSEDKENRQDYFLGFSFKPSALKDLTDKCLETIVEKAESSTTRKESKVALAIPYKSHLVTFGVEFRYFYQTSK